VLAVKTKNNSMFVNNMRLPISVLISCLFAACQSRNIRSVNLGDGVRAEGRITDDTTFDGVIKFYDGKTNQLIEVGNYVNGIHNGFDTIYNKNGSIAYSADFSGDKQNGYSYHFDSAGNLIEKSYNYYGLNVGGSINYLNDSVKEYYFYDLDENLLLYIDYDSIKGSKFGESHHILFFFHDSNYRTYDNRGAVHSGKTYFVYTPNPPKFDFKYSFVAIDSAYKIHAVLNEISNKQPWSIVNINWKPENPNQQLALRLELRDSINNKDMVAFKVLRD
jgi:hypothetical protein